LGDLTSNSGSPNFEVIPDDILFPKDDPFENELKAVKENFLNLLKK
jgi:hypothetical protein